MFGPSVKFGGANLGGKPFSQRAFAGLPLAFLYGSTGSYDAKVVWNKPGRLVRPPKVVFLTLAAPGSVWASFDWGYFLQNTPDRSAFDQADQVLKSIQARVNAARDDVYAVYNRGSVTQQQINDYTTASSAFDHIVTAPDPGDRPMVAPDFLHYYVGNPSIYDANDWAYSGVDQGGYPGQTAALILPTCLSNFQKTIGFVPRYRARVWSAGARLYAQPADPSDANQPTDPDALDAWERNQARVAEKWNSYYQAQGGMDQFMSDSTNAAADLGYDFAYLGTADDVTEDFIARDIADHWGIRI